MSVQQDQEARVPQESCETTASYRTGHVILCSCGCSWTLIRTPMSSVVCEHMDCLCGVTLMSWCEAADYRFEVLSCEEG